MELFRAKRIIQNEISAYKGEICGEALPSPIITAGKDGVTAKFEMTSNNNILQIINDIYQHVGKMEVSGIENYTFFKIPEYNLDITFTIDSKGKKSIMFAKRGKLEEHEIASIISTYKLCNSNPLTGQVNEPLSDAETRDDTEDDLLSFGASIFNPADSPKWESIAGYENLKDEIMTNVMLPIKNSDIIEKVANETRKYPLPKRNRGFLFHGYPGTGKTTVAKIIAGQAEIPMVYVQFEQLASCYINESAQTLSEFFDVADKLGNHIVFMDEIENVGSKRNYENSSSGEDRKVLSVLLKRLDGIESSGNCTFIGSTNRMDAMDDALLSRLTPIFFDLPKEHERKAIFENYAMQLKPDELRKLAKMSDGFSGRTIEQACLDAEKSWAREIAENKATSFVPPFDQYLKILTKRNGESFTSYIQ